jgi:hypothetical protein
LSTSGDALDRRALAGRVASLADDDDRLPVCFTHSCMTTSSAWSFASSFS